MSDDCIPTHYGPQKNEVKPGPVPLFAKIYNSGPIAYWPLWELTGTVAHCLINPLQNGTASGVTWGNAEGPDKQFEAPLFDGTNDYIDIFSATLDAAFDGATGTAMIWARAYDAGVWTDGAVRTLFNLYDDGNNGYILFKDIANNTVEADIAAGGGFGSMIETPFSDTDWFQIVLTWSDGANDDEAILYINAAVAAGPSAALNVWNGGGLDNTRTVIGAVNTTPTNRWHGWLAHCAIWDRVLDEDEIAYLAVTE